MLVPQIGSYWEKPSLVWGKESGSGEVMQSASPLGTTIQEFRALSEADLAELFAPQPPFEPFDIVGPCQRLAEMLDADRTVDLESMRLVNGFNREDCREMLDGAIQLLREFDPAHSPLAKSVPFGDRRLDLHRVPWGAVAVVLPQNAFLILGLTCLLAGLSTGNRVILRAPTVAGRSAGLLARLLVEAGFDPRAFSVVACDARQFLAALLKSPTRPLLHFLGSSRRAGGLFTQTFDAGCPCIIDGDGNVWVYVDADYDPNLAAEQLWQGAIRYSGQTCTSVNGVVVHPAIDSAFRARLRDLVATSKASRDGEGIGPLFTVEQAAYFEEAIRDSGGRMGRNGNLSENLMPGTLIEDPDWNSAIVREGLFAPALWVRTGDYEEFKKRWPTNKFPLGAGIMSGTVSAQAAAADLAGVARVVMNGDPSIEHVLEPWGGYPSSGLNPVGPWVDKYTRVVQIDRPG